MGIKDNEWIIVREKSRKSGGVVRLDGDPAEHKSIHSCERMFVPWGKDAALKLDVDHQPWPTLAVETGPPYENYASRLYLQYCADWWFTQSQGATKIVIIMYFDYIRGVNIVEKWVSESVAPFNKTLEQTIKIEHRFIENDGKKKRKAR